jgi:thiamine biosynthesis lipoprotein ApbE
MQSDALATGVMVLGVDRGLALLESLDRVEGYLITKSMDEYKTTGFV